MTRWLRSGAMGAALVLLVACGRQSNEPASADGFAGAPAAPAQTGARSPQSENELEEQSMLAYEHDVQVSLPADEIAVRVKASQQACLSKTFGACVVLQVRQQGGDRPNASLTVRIAPTGVEPMIAQASKGAEIGSRVTQAEDLAVVMRDNALARQRLRNERERLAEFQQRRDLAVADMIALSRQLAETDAQLQAAEQDGAQHRRRIDTQLLTMTFSPPDAQVGRSEVGQALRDFFATLATGTAWTIRALAFLLPICAVLLLIAFAIRRNRRKA